MMNRTNFIILTSVSVLVIGGGIYLITRANNRKKTQYNPNFPPSGGPPVTGPTGNNLDTDYVSTTRVFDYTDTIPIIRPIGDTTPPYVTTPIYTDKDFPLKKGSRGNKVKNLQTFLNNQGAQPTLRADGKFGPLTEAALIAWQQNKDNSPDGQMSEVMYNMWVLGLPV